MPIKQLSQLYFNTKKTRYAFIDGMACDTIDKAYQCMQDQLSLPDYFGKNLDSLDELLADLAWVKEKRVRLIISNLSQFLKGDEAKKEAFLAVLNEQDNPKLQVVYLGVTV